MGRLDRRIGRRGIRRRDLVDLRVLRAGIRQGQRHGVRGDAGAHDRRVVQARGVDRRTRQCGIPNGIRCDAADCERGCRKRSRCHRRARGQRGDRQVACAQAADRHRTHGDCVGPCERAVGA